MRDGEGQSTQKRLRADTRVFRETEQARDRSAGYAGSTTGGPREEARTGGAGRPRPQTRGRDQERREGREGPACR